MIEIKDIEKLALLARITIPESEKAKMVTDINKILEYVGQVSEAHASASLNSATSSAKGNKQESSIKNDHASMVRNVMRDDTNPHESGIFTEKLLAEVPKKEKNYVKVKKIL